MIGGSAFGNITRKMRLKFLAPLEREAITYSSSRIFRNSARVILATAVQLTIPMAKAIMGSEAPNKATNTMENNSVGKTWKNSVIRIRTSSTQPR